MLKYVCFLIPERFSVSDIGKVVVQYMNRFIRVVLFAIACGINALFYYLCGYWEQMFTSQTLVIDLLYGIVATVALAMIETRFGIQVVLRIRFAAYKKRVFDYRVWIQAVMLILYYVAAVVFVHSVEFVHGIFYITVLAVLMTVAWFGWVKGGRVLWTGEKESWFLNEDGRFYSVKKVTENEDLVFVVCALNAFRDKTVIIHKGTLEKIKAPGDDVTRGWPDEDTRDSKETDKIEAIMDATLIADGDAAHNGCKVHTKLYGRGIR